MRRTFAAVYVSGLLTNLPFFMIFVYTPVLAEDLGATNFQVGLLSTLYFVSSLLASYLWGGLSDVMGNRKLLPAFSCISLPVILLLLSIAGSPAQIILLNGLVGWIFPAYASPILALVSEEVEQRERGEKLGWFNSTRSLGSTIGLILAGYLVAYATLRYAFQLFALFTAFSLVPLLLIPGNIREFAVPQWNQILGQIKERMLSSKGGKHILHEKGLIYLYSALTLRVICIVGFASFLSIYIVKELGYSQEFLAAFSAYGNGLMIVGMFFAGWIADRLGRRITVILGFLLSGCVPIFYTLSHHLIILGLGRTLHSLGYCFAIGGITAFVGDLAGEESQGSFMGLITIFFSVGGVAGPVIMGSLLGYLGYSKMGVLMSLFAFSALIMTIAKVEEPLPSFE
ncbi:MFS transporter [Candidatus Bathyarchaeota archaeon]|nr:MFS transporter [Candidatus Bathyarchaeota archaeon]NIU81011.1 MFS transporter [Candidatus Bathyarchaeota archaeon]NIV67667.1 MFS transporter [Candidatus Bathyarchaeota archaeon]NIW16237.1 MFS transporter [Candidatus Bathyarchaeota archaeon]NIW34275.1 MFS transporter [Candidatus Bathyarchaeota archaeon]